MQSEKFEAPEPNEVPLPKLTLVKLVKSGISRATAWNRLADSLRAFQPKPRW